MFLPVIVSLVLICSSTHASNELGLRTATCQQDSLTRCTDPLKVLTNNRDLGFAASQQELNTLCPKLIDGLRCIDNFTSRCLDAQHREFFHMLYAGTKQVIVDLCEDEDYQKEYLMHAPCMRDVQSGYERCAVEYQSHVREHSGNNNNANGAGATLGGSSIADDPVENSKKLCCSFQNYMKCSQSVVAGKCGAQTASFTRGFLDTMAGPLIQGYCLSYEPGTEHEIECELPTSNDASLTSSSTYNNYEPSEQALDRSDGIEEERNVDETEFVSSRQNNQQQQHATAGSSSSLLSSRGVVSSWPLLTLLLLTAVSFLHYI
ncbi:hypothetical protein GHT06_010578 [Daphnia sinensis]|uniref:Uncharacterized protein n=1 Tax=Daphnia sinensis TaxID=1820382 RepID=A0AAD5KYP5_9CRUS|nr:hypothetical protein GHT06_010578 [Daphnia sinensis]